MRSSPEKNIPLEVDKLIEKLETSEKRILRIFDNLGT